MFTKLVIIRIFDLSSVCKSIRWGIWVMGKAHLVKVVFVKLPNETSEIGVFEHAW